MSDSWKSFKKDVEKFEMPDIAGIDGGTVQIILLIIVALWLFRKLKALFVIFLIIVGFYYFLQMGVI